MIELENKNPRFIFDVFKEFEKIKNSTNNIIENNKGTIFESKYPIIVFDYIDNKNNYLNSPNKEIKTIKIKNQKNDSFIVFLLKDLLRVRIDDDFIYIKVKGYRQQKISLK